MTILSRVVFACASGLLVITAIALVVVGFAEAIGDLRAGGHSGADAILNALGYVIVAVTVFDVAKYLFEEEVFREREKRSAAEARRSLTKFLSTIVIALFLEGLVVVFKTARTDVSQLIYPTALLVVAVLVLVGLGAYQRFSATVEQEVGQEDADAARSEDNRSKPKGSSRAKTKAQQGA